MGCKAREGLYGFSTFIAVLIVQFRIIGWIKCSRCRKNFDICVSAPAANQLPTMLMIKLLHRMHGRCVPVTGNLGAQADSEASVPLLTPPCSTLLTAVIFSHLIQFT